MEGIEVINSIPITEPQPNVLLIIIAVFAIIYTFVFALYLYNKINKRIDKMIYILLFILLFVSLISCGEAPTGKYEYQVTIDKSVSFIEFDEKYEVIDKDGKIYTIREKEE